jgi:cobalt-precorrin-5B (C1)-methyltransferase
MARQATTTPGRGWTTAACAAAAARAAFTAMASGRFPDPVSIRLPRGGIASVPLALAKLGEANVRARAGILKDAGDDPDVTHGELVIAETTWSAPGSGVCFAAGEGVGTVTRAGLPLAVGDPAINPAPRAMIRETLLEAAAENAAPAPDVTVTISIPGGERLAGKTMNARLGILGGLSIFGATGIVVPYSCASWIHSIHRVIDVARAAGLDHIAAATGATSERAVKRFFGLPDYALIDMGDFVGGTLKYLRANPIERLTIAGGFAKLAKFAAGHFDPHSAKSRIDVAALAEMLAALGVEVEIAQAARAAGDAAEILAIAGSKGDALARGVGVQAREVALATPCGETAIEVAVADRQGTFLARVGR